jgi:hypothetical protein
MSADADHDQPLGLLHAVLVLLRIDELAEIDLARLLDLLLGTMVDEDRLAAPGDGDALADLDGREIDLAGEACQRVLGWVEAAEERPDGAAGADRGDGGGGERQEIAPRPYTLDPPALCDMLPHKSPLRRPQTVARTASGIMQSPPLAKP